MDRTVNIILDEQGKDGFQEGGEIRFAHLAAAHGEFTMTNAAEPDKADIDDPFRWAGVCQYDCLTLASGATMRRMG